MSEDLPVFNLGNVERLRDRLVTSVFADWYGRTPVGGDLPELVRAVRAALPNGIAYDAVFESMRYVAGQQLTPLACLELAWRLAGNIPRLREGRPAPPWASQPEDEWVPVSVCRCLPRRNHRHKLGYHYTFRVLAGTPCPMVIYNFWAETAVRVVSRAIGFTPPWGKYPLQRGPQFVGLRMLVKIEAQRSMHTPTFFEVRCPQSLFRWNRQNVLKLRFRDGMTCPRGWTHACHQCVIGYRECPAGTHRENYTRGFCDKCGQHGFFDPDRRTDHCIQCDDKERRKRQNR